VVPFEGEREVTAFEGEGEGVERGVCVVF